MTAPIDQIRSLIARALHPGTPTEEARSCAMIAVRKIAEGGFLEPVREVRRPAPPPPQRPKPSDGGFVYHDETPFDFCDFTKTAEAQAKKKYGEGWERVWGDREREEALRRKAAGAPGAPPKPKCKHVLVSLGPGIPGRCMSCGMSQAEVMREVFPNGVPSTHAPPR